MRALEQKLRNAKIQLKIPCDARPEAFDFLGSSALHLHEREDELVYLWEGEIEVSLGDQKMKAVPGVMALLPRRIPHGNKQSRLLDTILPGQFDNYFVELSALFATGDPVRRGQLMRSPEKHRIKYL
jgi:Cupin domain